MLLHIENVLSSDELNQIHTLLKQAKWVDGKITAGSQSGQVKNNQQIPQNSEIGQELAHFIEATLKQNTDFFAAVLPKKIFPPLINRYTVGQNFGNHVDNSIRYHPYDGSWVRTDVSSTLFLNDPDEYEGGELVIDDNYGTHSVKLAAGDMVVYPATSLHRVLPITSGQRIASFFWTQSFVASDEKRTLLFDMDRAISSLRNQMGDTAELVSLTGNYHNLLRMWSEV